MAIVCSKTFVLRWRNAAVDFEAARQHALYVAIENRRTPPESEYLDRCSGGASTWEAHVITGIDRKLPGMLGDDDLRATMKIARPSVK